MGNTINREHRKQKKPVYLLVDGNSIMNRAYYGLAGRGHLSAPDGTPTAAIFACLNMLFSYVDQLDPDLLVCCFDTPEKNFRHALFPRYKSGRKPMPEDLAKQFPLIKEGLKLMGYTVLEKAGYEADDLLAGLTSEAEKAASQVYILSGDRDLWQLISEQCTLIFPYSNRNGSQTDLITPQAFRERYGFEAPLMRDLKALMGDSSDAIPGVPGIGEKTALDLLQQYGSLAGVYAHVDEMKGARKKRLQEGKELADLSYELVGLQKDLPFDFSEICRREVQLPELDSYLTRLGMKRFRQRFGLEEEGGRKAADFELNYRLSSKIETLFLSGKALALLELPDGFFAFYSEDSEPVKARSELQDEKTELISAEGRQLSLADLLGNTDDVSSPQEKALSHKKMENQGEAAEAELFLFKREDWAQLWPAYLKSGASAVLWGGKALLRREQLEIPSEPFFDVEIAAYLLNSLDHAQSAEEGFVRVVQAATGKALVLNEHPEDEKARADEAALIGRALLACQRSQLQTLKEEGMLTLCQEVEFPLSLILAGMERRGVYVSPERLDKLSREMSDEISSLEQQIYHLAGHSFNLNSSKQLSEVLFDELGLKGGKKKKDGSYSTAADELERLALDHPMIPLIMEHREISKLKSTFVDGLSREIVADGRIHTTFQQTLTSTGRLSSQAPNLQNIPTKSARAAAIRRAFCAEPGRRLLDADYSQIELRVLAALSGDKNLKKAFDEGVDVHRDTAARLFAKELDEVSPEERRAAKTVNFSIVYGVSDFGLATRLGVPLAEARRFIQAYDQHYSSVRSWLKAQAEKARELGYVTTILGRRRYIPELKSARYQIRQFGERAAMNAPVQGSAADIIKVAMIKTDRALKEAGLKTEIVLQVHDELLLEGPAEEAERAAACLKTAMEAAVNLGLALEVELGIGQSWDEIK